VKVWGIEGEANSPEGGNFALTAKLLLVGLLFVVWDTGGDLGLGRRRSVPGDSIRRAKTAYSDRATVKRGADLKKPKGTCR